MSFSFSSLLLNHIQKLIICTLCLSSMSSLLLIAHLINHYKKIYMLKVHKQSVIIITVNTLFSFLIKSLNHAVIWKTEKHKYCKDLQLHKDSLQCLMLNYNYCSEILSFMFKHWLNFYLLLKKTVLS